MKKNKMQIFLVKFSNGNSELRFLPVINKGIINYRITSGFALFKLVQNLSNIFPSGTITSNRGETIPYNKLTAKESQVFFNRYFLFDAAQQEMNFK